MSNYITLGSIGFAQLGSSEYYAKRTIEKQVLREFIETLVVPEEFSGACIGIKKFQYEDSSYDEVVLHYPTWIENKSDDWHEDYDEEFTERWVAFMNEMESVDFETPELVAKCTELYARENPFQEGYVRKPQMNIAN